MKLSRLCIGHTRLTHGHLLTRNDLQPTCTNAACRNQTLTVLKRATPKVQNPDKYKNTTGKRLLNRKDTEVSLGTFSNALIDNSPIKVTLNRE